MIAVRKLEKKFTAIEMETNFPITNNNLLPFLPSQASTKGSKCANRSRKDNQETKFDPGEISDPSNTDNDSFEILVSVATESYMYLVIIGSIALLSGLVISLISYHGLNTSKMSPVIGPLLFISGTFFGLLGIYFGKVSKQRSEDLIRRKLRYENFSEVFHPEVREEMFVISGRYQDRDIACFPSPPPQEQVHSNIRIDVSNETGGSVLSPKLSPKLSPRHIEIPSSRRSSFHGDSVEVARPETGASPLQLILVSPQWPAGTD